MVFCEKCGAKNPAKSEFCEQCGSRLIAPTARAPAVGPGMPRYLIPIVVVVVVIAVVGVVAAMLLTRGPAAGATPEGVIRAGVDAWNSYNADAYYDLLSGRIKAQYTKAQVRDMIEQAKAQGVKFTNFQVLSIDNTDSSASVVWRATLISTANPAGETQTITTPLAREGGVWKLDEI